MERHRRLRRTRGDASVRTAVTVMIVSLVMTVGGVPVAVGGEEARATSTPGATAVGFDRERFTTPPADSRATMLWFWNGTVTPELVDQQLGELRAQGIQDAIVFPFETHALQPSFFSEEWFELIDHTLREAQRHGMGIWLFNDNYFPSGRGAGLVVNGGWAGDRMYEPRPDLRAKGLSRTTQSVTGPTTIDPRRGDARAVSAVARPYGSTDLSEYVDLTAQVEAGEPWQAPAGDWEVDTFLATQINTTYLDLLDEEAVGRFLDAVPGEYQRRFEWAFGTVLRGFWDDEPFLPSAVPWFNQMPWSPDLHAELEALGTPPGVAFAAALQDLGRDGRVARGRYWRAVSDRFAEAYYRQQGEWMAARGVQFISNPLWDEQGPAEQVANTGDLSKDHQWTQVPGTDVVFHHYPGGNGYASPRPLADGLWRTLPRYAASSAHQNGQERVMLEAFGAMGWHITPEYAHGLLGAFASRGINATTWHAMWSDTGNVQYPPPFQTQNPWWRLAGGLNDWIGRVMEVGRGTPVAQTALIQPQRAAEAWQATPTLAQVDHDFRAAAHALEDAWVDFDLLSEGALDGDPRIRSQAEAADGRLHVGEQTYRFAVLPPTPTLSLATAQALADFVAGGGTLVAVGALPQEEAAGRDAALQQALGSLFADGGGTRQIGAGRTVRVSSAGDVGAVAHQFGVAAASFTPAPSSVRVIRRASDSGVSFMLNNESNQVVRTAATFPVDGTPELWNPETGTTAPATTFRQAQGGSGTVLPMVLQPYQTVIVVFPAGASEVPHLLSGDATVEALTLDGDSLRVDAVLDAPGSVELVGTADGRTFRGRAATDDPLTPVQLDGLWTTRFNDLPAVLSSVAVPLPLGSWTTTHPTYSGTVTHQRDITLDAAQLDGRRMILDLGDVRDAAEVTVNGHAFDPLLWRPYRLDVTGALQPGTNTITVAVTNTLANSRGDVRQSGLLGPVALLPHALVTTHLAEG